MTFFLPELTEKSQKMIQSAARLGHQLNRVYHYLHHVHSQMCAWVKVKNFQNPELLKLQS